MSILALGLSYRSAPLRLLEQASAGVSDAEKVLASLVSGEHVGEAVLLSTCNRVEVYVNAATFHGGLAEVSDVLATCAGVPLEELTRHLYVHHDARAVQHLFSVASGLDSMLIGESQIIGQLREAFRVAQQEKTVGRVVGELLRHGLRVGKRVRTVTGIDRAGSSLVTVGLEMSARALGGLAGRPALVVGAGATGRLASQMLRRAGIGELVVVNRTPERAERLAGQFAGTAAALADLPELLAGADVVVSSTAATGVMITATQLAAVQQRRGGRPLAVLDLALPHDVDPDVRQLPGVTLLDLDALRAVTETGGGGSEVEAARAVVAEEVSVFLGWQRAMRVAPTVVALRAKADALVEGELLRLRARVPTLAPDDYAEVADAVRRVAEKLLHGPTVRVKELAESPGGDAYADALRELFGLDRKAAEAVSRPEQERPQ